MAKRRERTTMDLIRALRDGTASGKQLSQNQRQSCVEMLALEGMQTSEIADLIGRCDRTIRRDLQQIRTENALHPSDGLGPEILGEYRTRVESSVSRLHKLQRDPNATITDKITAVRSAVEIYDRFVERLCALGFICGERVSSQEQVNFAELVHVAGVISSEFSEDSPMAIEIRALIARMHSGQGPSAAALQT